MQPSLLDLRPSFDGSTFSPTEDGPRLSRQLAAVLALMQDGRPRTLQQISEATGVPLGSVGSRVRDLRKAKFGGYTVQRTRVSGGLYTYTLGE